MIDYLRLSLFSFLYLFSIATLNLQAFAQQPATLTPTDVTGFWRLNVAESDDPIQKMNEFIRAASTAPVSEKSKNLPPMTESIFHPDGLVVVAGNGDVTINEVFKDVVETRSIYTDGVTRTFAVTAGANYSITAKRSSGVLVVETVSPRGNKMTETYEITAKGRKLSTAMRIDDTAGREVITIHRVYDRAVADFLGGDDGEMQ